MTSTIGAQRNDGADIPDDAAHDYAVLTEQADALRAAGRHAAADQLLAWRDLHVLRHRGGKD